MTTNHEQVFLEFVKGHDELQHLSYSKTKIKIACPKHGIFEQQPSNHLTGNGCPKCNNKIKSERYSFHLEYL